MAFSGLWAGSPGISPITRGMPRGACLGWLERSPVRSARQWASATYTSLARSRLSRGTGGRERLGRAVLGVEVGTVEREEVRQRGDEYHRLVYPLVLGSGKRLSEESTEARFELINATTFGTGVVALVYRPVTATPA